ncbi:MAG: hypothetical protein ACKVTZ_21555 [Bacteroidia bacterium]
MNRIIILSFWIVLSLFLTSCIEEVPKGRQTISAEARTWQVYESAEKVVFTNEDDVTMSLLAGERKSVFNDVTHCFDVNQFQEQCEIYSMEYDHVLLKTVGSQFVVTYALEKQVKEGKLYDCLVINLQERDFPTLRGKFTLGKEVTGEDKGVTFLPSIELQGKTFQSVYKIADEALGQALYLTKDQGIIAFNANEELWVLK